jgi:AcrR family transcriptional regulator
MAVTSDQGPDPSEAADPLHAGASLRERKRLRAMRRIQVVALDLFDAHGYDEVTIERVAAAAEVSPSSVYRYFGTKEQLVLWDEYDPLILGGVLAELGDHPPLPAFRRVFDALLGATFERDEGHIRRRTRYVFEVPAVEAAAARQTQQLAATIAAIFAEQLGRDPTDLDLLLAVHALVGALEGGIRHWYRSGFATPFPQVMDRVFASFEEGFALLG